MNKSDQNMHLIDGNCH